MIPFGLSSLMTVSLPIGRRATKCLVPGASAIYLCNQGTGTTLTDFSGNGNHGTLGAGAAAPTWTQYGLSFDGGDSVFCPNFMNAAGAPFCIDAVATYANTTGYHTLIAKATGFDKNCYGFGVRQNGTAMTFSLLNPTGAEVKITAANAVSMGGTSHVTAVFDGAVASLYMNGVLAAGPTAAAHFPATDQAVTIGRYSHADVIPLIGTLHGMAIYPFAPSVGQVAQNDAALKGILAPRTIVW